jgi:N-acetylmuramoyl-L-alanine amidase
MKLALVAVVTCISATLAAANPRVVLDPGHGGSNSGAKGTTGLYEKQLTLALAEQVAARLRDKQIDVSLTRDHDDSRTLRQRVMFANAHHADLFVSIHANASPTRTQRGWETWILSAKGVATDARALRSDVTTPRPGVDTDTAAILDDVERGATQWEAADLAVRIQHALHDRRAGSAAAASGNGPADRGVRQEAHHVLLGATMPAVLVEVGFIDHPIEGRELAQPAVEDQLADALADAITEQLAD